MGVRAPDVSAASRRTLLRPPRASRFWRSRRHGLAPRLFQLDAGLSARRSPLRPSHAPPHPRARPRSEEHTSELQSPDHLVCRLLLEKKKKRTRALLLAKGRPPASGVTPPT